MGLLLFDVPSESVVLLLGLCFGERRKLSGRDLLGTSKICLAHPVPGIASWKDQAEGDVKELSLRPLRAHPSFSRQYWPWFIDTLIHYKIASCVHLYLQEWRSVSIFWVKMVIKSPGAEEGFSRLADHVRCSLLPWVPFLSGNLIEFTSC